MEKRVWTKPLVTAPAPSPYLIAPGPGIWSHLPWDWDSDTWGTSLLLEWPWRTGWELWVKRKGFRTWPLEKACLWEERNFSRSLTSKNWKQIIVCIACLSRTCTLHSKVLPCLLTSFQPRRTMRRWSREAEGEQLCHNKLHRVVRILFLPWAFYKTYDCQLVSFLEWCHALWRSLIAIRFLRDCFLILMSLTWYQFYASFCKARVLVTHTYFYYCFIYFFFF